jgi:hypothetical protein
MSVPVTDEMAEAAAAGWMEYWLPEGRKSPDNETRQDGMRAALFAAAPLIAAAERERSAAMVGTEKVAVFECKPTHWEVISEFGKRLRSHIAATIRARGTP